MARSNEPPVSHPPGTPRRASRRPCSSETRRLDSRRNRDRDGGCGGSITIKTTTTDPLSLNALIREQLSESALWSEKGGLGISGFHRIYPHEPGGVAPLYASPFGGLASAPLGSVSRCGTAPDGAQGGTRTSRFVSYWRTCFISSCLLAI